MTRKKKIDMDTLLGEMGAVAAFANSGTAEPEAGVGEDERESLLSTLVLTPEPALARERRRIADGRYEVTIGWDAEPAIEGQKNAVAFSVARVDGVQTEPVDGIERTLSVRLRRGADVRDLPARPVPGHPGQYAAHFIPTRPGSYTFTLLGSVEGQPVEESFDSTSGEFAEVESAASVQFPTPTAEPSRAAASAPEADSAARVGRALAIAGFGFGFLGVLATWRAWASRSHRLDSAVGASASRGAGRAPADARSSDESPAALGESSGPSLQDEIAVTLQPIMSDFRQDIAQTVRTQTAQAFQASGWTAA